MLWLGIRFAHLALDSACMDQRAACASPIDDAQLHKTIPAANVSTSLRAAAPLAIIDGPLQRRQIVFANRAAAKSGVHAGQGLATAQMLCPHLACVPRDPAAERQTLESLAAWAYRFSADISISSPDTLFIEIGASLALFGGWPNLQRRLRSELDAFGFVCSFAAAPNASAARILATHANGIAILATERLTTALGAVPLAASGLDAKVVSALRGMGFSHLRDLFRLPRAELARRIGADALGYLDRARGMANESWLRWQPPQRFERRIEFSSAIETQAALAFALQRLIRELAFFLTARDGGVERFTLVLGHEHGACTRVEIGLLAPQRDAASLFEIARARLDRIELVAPVHALTLCATDLPALCPLHQDLFETAQRETLGWPALAERLRSRLGDHALRGLRLIADHRPARAWDFCAHPPKDTPRERSRDASSASTRKKNPTRGDAPTRTLAHTAREQRPFWLLHRPIPLRGMPARILAGPERIETGWWDERDQRRDYYVIETRRGQRAWAFVEAGLPIDRGNDVPWTLHGWFS